MRNDRRSNAVRLVRSRDIKERKIAYDDYPELRKLIPVINLVRSGFGTYKEIMAMKDDQIQELLELSDILTIIQQEEELDNANSHKRFR